MTIGHIMEYDIEKFNTKKNIHKLSAHNDESFQLLISMTNSKKCMKKLKIIMLLRKRLNHLVN